MTSIRFTAPRAVALTSLAALLALGVLAADCRAAEAGPPVVLKFDWPAGLRGELRSTTEKTRLVDGQPVQSVKGSLRYEMTTRRVGDELLIAYGDPRIEEMSQPLSEAQRAASLVMARATAPAYRVSRQGSFVALDNAAELAQVLRQFIAGGMPDKPMSAEQRRTYEQISAPEAISASAHSEWNSLVGMWTGAEQQGFELGEDYQTEDAAPPPVIGGDPIEIRATFRFLRRLPCERAGRTLECVEVRVVQEPNSDQLAEAVLRFIQRLAPEAREQFKLREMQTRITIEALIEPATLLPHRHRLHKEIMLVESVPGGSRRSVASEDKLSEFRYGAAP